MILPIASICDPYSGRDIGVFNGVDEFMYALIFMNSQSNKTITVAMLEFSYELVFDDGMMMAVGCIATVIPVAISIIFQKNITQGLRMGQ